MIITDDGDNDQPCLHEGIDQDDEDDQNFVNDDYIYVYILILMMMIMISLASSLSMRTSIRP